MVKHVLKFDKNCKSFRNFDDGIRRDTTRRTYQFSLDELVRFGNFKGYDELAKLETDEIHEFLKEWIRYLKNKNLKFKTIKTKLNAAELFFIMNKKSFHKELLHKILPDSDELVGGDEPFTTDELARLRQAAKKPRDIAIIDFLGSTGVRPGCLSDPVLKRKHLKEMPRGCIAVRVYDDSKEGYWAFLTPEATKSLKRYLRSRERNGEELTGESVLFKTFENPHKKKDYLTADSIRQTLTNLMKLAVIERKKIKNRHDKAIIYGFRKRFHTVLKLKDGLNSNIAEKLMGHKNGSDGNYLRPTLEQCFFEFEKAIPDLTLDPTEKQKIMIEKQQKELSELEKQKEENSKLIQMMDGIKIDLEKVKKRQEVAEKYS